MQNANPRASSRYSFRTARTLRVLLILGITTQCVIARSLNFCKIHCAKFLARLFPPQSGAKEAIPPLRIANMGIRIQRSESYYRGATLGPLVTPHKIDDVNGRFIYKRPTASSPSARHRDNFARASRYELPFIARDT